MYTFWPWSSFCPSPLATTGLYSVSMGFVCFWFEVVRFHMWDHTVFVFVWLISLSLIPSGPDLILQELLWGWISFLPQFIDSVGQMLRLQTHQGFPHGSDSKESVCNVKNLGLIPGLGRSPGGGHGSPLQYSCLENPHGQRSLAGCSSRVENSRTWLSG